MAEETCNVADSILSVSVVREPPLFDVMQESASEKSSAPPTVDSTGKHENNKKFSALKSPIPDINGTVCRNIAKNSCVANGNRVLLPLYLCNNCKLTICAGCAMAEHVEFGHECTKMSTIREKLGRELGIQLEEIKNFTDDEFKFLSQKMEDMDRRLTGNLADLRKLCQRRNQLQTRAVRMLNGFDIDTDQSGIGHIQGTIFALTCMNNESKSLQDSWKALERRIFDSWRSTTPNKLQEAAPAPEQAPAKKGGYMDESVYKFELGEGEMSDRSRGETPSSSSTKSSVTDKAPVYKEGNLVWAKVGKSGKLWPAMVLDPLTIGVQDPKHRAVNAYWFGYNRISEKVGQVVPFEENFLAKYKAQDQSTWYHCGVIDAIRELLSRKKGKRVSEDDPKYNEDWLLKWATDGFSLLPSFRPLSPSSFVLPDFVKEVIDIYNAPEKPKKKRKAKE